jgi:hypothetical protein
MAGAMRNTDSVRVVPQAKGYPIAGSACVLQRPAARSVWPRTNDLGALDLSARLARIAYTTPARIGGAGGPSIGSDARLASPGRSAQGV